MDVNVFLKKSEKLSSQFYFIFQTLMFMIIYSIYSRLLDFYFLNTIYPIQNI